MRVFGEFFFEMMPKPVDAVTQIERQGNEHSIFRKTLHGTELSYAGFEDYTSCPEPAKAVDSETSML